MAKGERYPGPLVFGLDIGTRSIVGTVGYMFNKKFHVIAIQSRLHETRAMLDGQIHDSSCGCDHGCKGRAPEKDGTAFK